MELPLPSAPASAPAPRRATLPVRATGPLLWAVASGKGGVGKSVVSSSLAVALAQTGPRVAIVDLDLGGANLHTLLGCDAARHTLADVLSGRVREVCDALSPTTVPGVVLLSGARAFLDAANPHYAQKQRLLRQLRRLDVAHVVLDLGAGSAFNALDAFVAADRRLLVTTPETTAVENARHFLKAAFFRSLRPVAREPGVRELLREVLEEGRRRGATPRELVEAAGRRDPAAGARLRERLRALDVDLIVNRSDHRIAARDPGPRLAEECRELLGISLRRAATLPCDESVPAAVGRGVPVMQLFPGCAFCEEFRALAEALVAGEPVRAPAPPPPRTRRADGASPGEIDAAPPLALPLPDYEGVSPGRYLRVCRELQGISLAELFDRTRIRHLDAIEAECFDALPPEPYLRGFVRQVAESLGVDDPAALAARFIDRAREHRRARCRRRFGGFGD